MQAVQVKPLNLRAAVVGLLAVVCASWASMSLAAQSAATPPPESVAKVVEAGEAVAKQPLGPEEVVREASNELLRLIDEAKGYVDEDPEKFFTAIQDLLDPVVAFPAFARNVMGPHWKRATPDQRKRFVETFKQGLLRTYALALTQLGEGEVVVLPPDRPARRPDRRAVRMEIRTPSGDIFPIVYTMRLDKRQNWRMRNIVVGGVNIGLTYRSQFAGAVKDPAYGGDLDKVIDAWAGVVAEQSVEG